MAGASEQAKVQAVALRCASCGAPWTMRGFNTTRTVACESCGTVFDASRDEWQLVQKVPGAFAAKPVYALGTRGRLDGIEWEVVGWAKRSVTSYGTRFVWEEHLLYNPYEGFRYLMFQDGHFVLVEPLGGIPATGINRAVYEGRTYRHFSSADATVDEVLGEFPWEVRRGDVATASDYVDPPYIASSEQSEGELVWSGGRYLEREEVVAAFGRPTRSIREPKGVHPCQPNPYKALARWMVAALAVGLCVWVVMSGVYFGARDRKILWTGPIPDDGTSVHVEVDGARARSVLQFTGEAAVTGTQYLFFNVVLVDPTTERSRYIPLEINRGSSAGERPGTRAEKTLVGGIPRGTHLLQVRRDPGSTYKGALQLTIRRDVPLWRWPCITFLLLFVVPVLVLAQSWGFEHSRWSQSDHAD